MKILGLHILKNKSLEKKIEQAKTETRQITNKQTSNMLYRNHTLAVEIARREALSQPSGNRL